MTATDHASSAGGQRTGGGSADFRLAAIVQSSDDAIISKDLNGTILSWNPAAEHIFGYSPEEAIGKSIRMIIPADRQQEEDEVLAKLRAGERIDHFETVRCRKDGSAVLIALTVSPVRDPSGRIVGASKIARDITEQRQRADELLRVTTERAAIFDSVIDCIISIDADGTIRDFNPAARRAFGYTHADAVGARFGEAMIAPESQAEFEAALAALVGDANLTRRGQQYQVTARRRNGGTFPAELTISAVSRARQLFTVILHDISERRAIEEAVRQSLELKDQFLNLVSHELRTPIAIIAGNGQILLQRGSELDDADRQASLTDLVANAQRLQTIIENLLLLTRTRGGEEFQSEPVHLPRVAEGIVSAFGRRKPDRPVRVEINGPIPLAMSEPTLVSLVLENLLSNADKYSPPGAPIEIVFSRSEDGRGQVEVNDRGIGMNEAEAAQVFTPFFRTEAAKARAGGMGLGLAVCERVLEAQGGSIWVRPREGGGSTFGFSLPSLDL